MEIEHAKPLKEPRLGQVHAFLKSLELRFDESVQSTVVLVENDEVIATGSRENNVLKCIGVDSEKQGEGLAAIVMTELVKEAFHSGIAHLFLFTKPQSVHFFKELGFFPVAQTSEIALMENRRNGIKSFVNSLEKPERLGKTGAIVANCNPFTNGHLHLIETAAAACDTLHVFVLSEDQSTFSFETRMALVRAGTADLPNVLIHPTGDYLISSATFPDYFIKDKKRSQDINCELDLTIFAECFAKLLHIDMRFVGSEPNCPVTAAYNRQMHDVLPRFGICVEEIPRIAKMGRAISASDVRALLEQGKLEEIKALVPETTYRFLERMKADESAGAIC